MDHCHAVHAPWSSASKLLLHPSQSWEQLGIAGQSGKPSHGPSPPHNLLLPCSSLSHSFLYLPPPSLCAHTSCGKLHLERESPSLGTMLHEEISVKCPAHGITSSFRICSFWFLLEQLQSSLQQRLGTLSLISASHLCISQELSRGGNQVAKRHWGSKTKRQLKKKNPRESVPFGSKFTYGQHIRDLILKTPSGLGVSVINTHCFP